nr:substrate-binding domain-containing protein [Streptomyces tendae]
MEAGGTPVPEAYVRPGEFTYETGLLGATALLGLPEPPTAIFAGNDEIAAGVVENARRRGPRVPEDLSVVGFDDTSLARMASPPLTTVRQPLRRRPAYRAPTRQRREGRVPPHRARHRTRGTRFDGAATRGVRGAQVTADRSVRERGDVRRHARLGCRQ